MTFINSRGAYRFDPEDDNDQNTGGLLALLRQAMQQEALKGSSPGAVSDPSFRQLSDRYGNPQGLPVRLLASQAGPGLSVNAGNGANSPQSLDPSFGQFAPSSANQSGAGRASPTQPSEADTRKFEVAQSVLPPPVFFGMPYSLFARPPSLFPRALPRIEDWPTGSSKGPGVGKNFKRFPPHLETPPCSYCLRQTTREPGPLRFHQDHGIPKTRGGDNSDENKNPACQECNLEKGPMTPEEYYYYLKRKGAPTWEDRRPKEPETEEPVREDHV